MENKKKIIDPPSGWRYGFPKEIPDSIITEDDLKHWLVYNGYPEEDVDLALKYSRVWEE
jgi:hypothetical protein